MSGLNPQQQAIVDNTDGYRLVLAGAGSGKTYTVTANITSLLEKNMAQPWQILAVTFTNKAAKEMKERLEESVGEQSKKLWVGTFHGICIRLLARFGKHIGLSSTFSIADERDQVGIVKKIISDNASLSGLEPADLLQAISRFKNNLLSPDEVALDNDIPSAVVEAYAMYQEKLKGMNCLDFDDIIMATVYMIRNIPEVKESIQEQFKYVFVDESQDCNTANYQLALLISDKSKNLTLVGDVDQGIYSWRGSDVGLVQDFMSLPGTRVFNLTTNYRCAGNIIGASNALIDVNKNRPEKELLAHKPSGDKIALYKADTEYYEAEYVAGIIDYLCHRVRSNDYKDFFILYRSNNQARVLEEKLVRRRIPAQVVNGISFFQRAEIKDTLAYLRLICNPYDIMALSRIANSPKRGIGDVTLNKITSYLIDNKLDVVTGLKQLEIPRLSKKAKAAMIELSDLLAKYTAVKNNSEKVEIARFIRAIMSESGYIQACKDANEDERAHNIYDLADMAENTQEFEGEGLTLEGFIRDLCLMGDTDSMDGDNTVKMMTIHSAKGLENEIVFLVGMEENVFPAYKSVKDNDEALIEEERRLAYVALTRAKSNLYITYCENRSQFGETKKQRPSRFLKEIPEEFIVDITKLA